MNSSWHSWAQQMGPGPADGSPLLATQDQVIEQFEAQRLTGLLHPCREAQVFIGRRRVAGRVVVEKNDAGGIAAKGFAQDRPGLDNGSHEVSAKALHLAGHPLVDVEEKCAEHFLIDSGVAQVKVAGDHSRVGQKVGLLGGGHEPAAELHRGKNRSCLLVVQALGAGDSEVAVQKAHDAAADVEQLAGKIVGAFFSCARDDERQ